MVRPRDRAVQLIPALGAVFHGPEHAVRPHRGALRVAVAEGVNLRLPAALAVDERVVRVRRAVAHDADDGTLMRGGVLRLLPPAAVADGDEKRAVRRDQYAGAVMVASGAGRFLPEDDFKLIKPGRVAVDQPGAGDGGLGVPAVRRGGVREIDFAAFGEVRRQCDVEQTALTFGDDLWDPRDGGRQGAVAGYMQIAAFLRHQNAAARKEGEPPRLGQAVDLLRDADPACGTVENPLLRRSGQGGDQEGGERQSERHGGLALRLLTLKIGRKPPTPKRGKAGDISESA